MMASYWQREQMYLCWHKEHTTHGRQETDPATTKTNPSVNHSLSDVNKAT
jgi:hypothetical protein